MKKKSRYTEEFLTIVIFQYFEDFSRKNTLPTILWSMALSCGITFIYQWWSCGLSQYLSMVSSGILNTSHMRPLLFSHSKPTSNFCKRLMRASLTRAIFARYRKIHTATHTQPAPMLQTSHNTTHTVNRGIFIRSRTSVQKFALPFSWLLWFIQRRSFDAIGRYLLFSTVYVTVLWISAYRLLPWYHRP